MNLTKLATTRLGRYLSTTTRLGSESCSTCLTTVEPKKPAPTSGPMKKVTVTVIDSLHPVGVKTVFCLKSSPIIKELRVHCKGNTLGLAYDLTAINTGPKVKDSTGDEIKTALKKTDIVLCTGGVEPYDVSTDADIFESNMNYMRTVATHCAKLCPEAIIVIGVYPINSTVPMFASIMSQHGVFSPNRIMGIMSLYTMRARTMIGTYLGMDPSTVKVTVVGGGTPDTMVPVLFSSTPGGPFLNQVVNELSSAIKNTSAAVWSMNKRQAVLSAAHANSSLINKIALGLTGHPTEGTAFIRTSTLYGLKYASMPVEFGLDGVSKNLGLPQLSSREMKELDLAIPLIQNDIKRGENAAKPMIKDENVPAVAQNVLIH